MHASTKADEAENEREPVSTDLLKATPRRGCGISTDVDLDDERNGRVLIQPGPNGYQVDMWWEALDRDATLQNSNWVRFGEQQGLDYPHNNRHDRRGKLHAEGETIRIHDPDPRAPLAGYGGADILVDPHPDEEVALTVTLQWTDEYTDTHEYAIEVPYLDPRFDKEAYYDYLLPTKDTVTEE